MPKREFYKSVRCCTDTDCYRLDSEDAEPCWGQVRVIAEDYDEDDYWWIHACEGHEDCPYLDKYKPEFTLTTIDLIPEIRTLKDGWTIQDAV